MVVAHHLTQDEAVKRIKSLFSDVKMRCADQISDLHEEWDGNTGKIEFSARGLRVSGTLTVKTSQVEISGKLPFAAIFLKKKIEAAIEDHMKTLLA
jgi:hypothetical protein